MPSPRPAQEAGPQPGQLHGVLAPIVADAGFELDQLDVRAAGRRHTVKVVVDSDAGVGLDDIAAVSGPSRPSWTAMSTSSAGPTRWRSPRPVSTARSRGVGTGGGHTCAR